MSLNAKIKIFADNGFTAATCPYGYYRNAGKKSLGNEIAGFVVISKGSGQLSFLFLKFLYFDREKESAHMYMYTSGGGAESERERIPISTDVILWKTFWSSIYDIFCEEVVMLVTHKEAHVSYILLGTLEKFSVQYIEII